MDHVLKLTLYEIERKFPNFYKRSKEILIEHDIQSVFELEEFAKENYNLDCEEESVSWILLKILSIEDSNKNR